MKNKQFETVVTLVWPWTQEFDRFETDDRETKTKKNRMVMRFLYGRDDRIWTCDHFVPNEVRYQAALHPGYLQAPPAGIEPATNP